MVMALVIGLLLLLLDWPLPGQRAIGERGCHPCRPGIGIGPARTTGRPSQQPRPGPAAAGSAWEDGRGRGRGRGRKPRARPGKFAAAAAGGSAWQYRHPGTLMADSDVDRAPEWLSGRR